MDLKELHERGHIVGGLVVLVVTVVSTGADQAGTPIRVETPGKVRPDRLESWASTPTLGEDEDAGTTLVLASGAVLQIAEPLSHLEDQMAYLRAVLDASKMSAKAASALALPPGVVVR